MNRLLTEATDDQRAVLNVIYGEFDGHARWPIWQYVDLMIKPQGAAGAALAGMPRVRDTRYGVGLTYGWAWWENLALNVTPGPEAQMEMTVAGLWALGFDVLPRLYIRLLHHCAILQSQLRPSPTDPVYVNLDVNDLRQALFEDWADGPAGSEALRLAQLRLVAQREPPTIGRITTIQDGTWSLRVPADIVDYGDVESVPDYLNRVAQAIEPAQPPFASSSDSPFTVPDIVSFLDAVWAARVGSPLFVNIDPARAASLLYDAQTPDEFDSRCSALADILHRIAVPPDPSLRRKGVRPVVLLGQWLTKRLPEGPALRVDEATAVLSKIVNIRVAGQHTNERHKAVEAFQDLGLTYPPVDWSVTWAAMRRVAVNALEAIRQEIAANLTASDLEDL